MVYETSAAVVYMFRVKTFVDDGVGAIAVGATVGVMVRSLSLEV